MGYKLYLTEDDSVSAESLVDQVVNDTYKTSRRDNGVYHQICFWNCRTAPITRCGMFVDRRVFGFVKEWNTLYNNLQIGYHREYLSSGYDGIVRTKPHKDNEVFGVFSLNFPREFIESGLSSRIILFFRLFGTGEEFLTRLTASKVFDNLSKGTSALKGVISAGSIRTVHNLVNPGRVEIEKIVPSLNDPAFIEEHKETLQKNVRQTPFWESLSQIINRREQ